MFGGDIEEGGPTYQQFKCIFDNASDETVLKIFEMGGSGEAGQAPTAEVINLAIKCGLGTGPGQGEGGEDEGSQPTAEQLGCFIEAVGEAAFNEIVSGQRAPTVEEAMKIQECGLPMGPDSGKGGGGSEKGLQPTAEQLDCLIAAIGQTAFNEITSGQRAPTLEEVMKIQECGLPMGPDSDQGGGGSEDGPQPTAEQLDCLIAAIGQTAFNEITSGQRAPTLEEAMRIQECGLPMGPEPGEGQ
jgi:hypothetical protein